MKTRIPQKQFIAIVFQAFFLLFFLAAINLSYVSKELEINEPDRFAIYTRYLFFIVSLLVIALNVNRLKFKGIHLICILWFMFMFPALFYSGAMLQVYSHCLMWPVVFEAMYFLILDGQKVLKSFRTLFIPVFIVGIIYFFRASFLTNFGIQTNMVFYAILCFPWLLLYKSKSIKLIFMILITLLALLSMKRSMMLIVAFFWAILGIYILFSSSNKIIASIIFVFVLGGSFLVFNYVDDFLGGSLSARFEENEDEKGGGRKDIYEATGLLIISSSWNDLIIGHGHHAVARDSILEHSAHNDFMEIIYDYGLVEFVVYLSLWVYLFKKMFFLVKIKSKYRISYFASLSCFIVMSTISHLVLYANYFLFLVMYWAAIEALIPHCKHMKKGKGKQAILNT